MFIFVPCSQVPLFPLSRIRTVSNEIEETFIKRKKDRRDLVLQKHLFGEYKKRDIQIRFYNTFVQKFIFTKNDF